MEAATVFRDLDGVLNVSKQNKTTVWKQTRLQGNSLHLAWKCMFSQCRSTAGSLRFPVWNCACPSCQAPIESVFTQSCYCGASQHPSSCVKSRKRLTKWPRGSLALLGIALHWQWRDLIGLLWMYQTEALARCFPWTLSQRGMWNIASRFVTLALHPRNIQFLLNCSEQTESRHFSLCDSVLGYHPSCLLLLLLLWLHLLLLFFDSHYFLLLTYFWPQSCTLWIWNLFAFTLELVVVTVFPQPPLAGGLADWITVHPQYVSSMFTPLLSCADYQAAVRSQKKSLFYCWVYDSFQRVESKASSRDCQINMHGSSQLILEKFQPTSFCCHRKDRKMALMQLASVEEAIEALITLHDHQLDHNQHLRVSFSKSTIWADHPSPQPGFRVSKSTVAAPAVQVHHVPSMFSMSPPSALWFS